MKDIFFILLLSKNRNKDLNKLANIFAEKSLNKFKSYNQNNKVITKGITQKKVITDNEKVIPSKNKVITKGITKGITQEKVITNDEKVITDDEKVITDNENINNEKVITLKKKDIYVDVRRFIEINYSDNEEIKKKDIIDKFEISNKKWYTILKLLKENDLVYTKGTTTYKKGITQEKKVITN